MAESKDGFVSRWSRRKRDGKAAARRPAVEAGADTATIPEQETVPAEPATAGPPEKFDPASLPDPDTLGADSDYTVFLKDGVPETLRRRALRRLWRSNPLLANLDGLNDYDEDYTDAATVVAGMKTLYQVGKGFVIEEEEKDQGEKAGESAAEAGARPDDSDLDSDEPLVTEEAGADPPDSVHQDVAALEVHPVPARHVVHPAAPRRGALERRWGREND